ncbi:unnamed protein product, partial [Brenthis ino]
MAVSGRVIQWVLTADVGAASAAARHAPFTTVQIKLCIEISGNEYCKHDNKICYDVSIRNHLVNSRLLNTEWWLNKRKDAGKEVNVMYRLFSELSY